MTPVTELFRLTQCCSLFRVWLDGWPIGWKGCKKRLASSVRVRSTSVSALCPSWTWCSVSQRASKMNCAALLRPWRVGVKSVRMIAAHWSARSPQRAARHRSPRSTHQRARQQNSLRAMQPTTNVAARITYPRLSNSVWATLTNNIV
jgi:hypothetical protein